MIEASIEIEYNRRIDRNTWLMGLPSPRMSREARPGQFVMIRTTDALAPLLRRPFSIGGILGDTLLVLYRVVGEGTRCMAAMRGGDRVRVLGPLGRGFTIPDAAVQCLLVGGGIGVAPLFFLAQAMQKRKSLLLAGFPTAGDILLPEDIGLHGIPCSLATEDGSRGYAGFVTGLFEQQLDRTGVDPAALRLFTCGPPPMLLRMAVSALERGIPCQVSLEARMACGLGACQGCAVPAAAATGRPYVHVCQDGPVFRAEEIDWERLRE